MGAFEDEDDDVYATESLNNYDYMLTENKDKHFGWTAPKHHGIIHTFPTTPSPLELSICSDK